MSRNNQQSPRDSSCCSRRLSPDKISCQLARDRPDSDELEISKMSEFEQQPARCLYLEYGRENLVRGKRWPALEPIDRLNRWFVMLFGAYLCNVDLKARLNDQNEQTRQVGTLKWGALKRSSWRRELKFGWISQVVTGLFVVLLGHLLTVAYYQYSFDFDLIKSRSYGKRNAGTLAESDTNLTATMREARRQLERLASSAFLHQTMIIECVYMSLVIYAVMIYLVPFVFHGYFAPFDFQIVRELLDPKQELDSLGRSIERGVADFIESSRMFMLSRSSVTRKSFGQIDRMNGSKLRASYNPIMNYRRTLAKMNSYETKLDKHLRDMLNRSALLALNRRPTNIWPQLRSSVQLLCHLASALYCILFDVLIIWGSFIWPNSGPHVKKLRLSQSLVMFTGIGLLMINLPSVAMFMPVYFTATIDQISFVNELIKLIERCIESNRLSFKADLSDELSSGGQKTESPQTQRQTKQSKLINEQQQKQPLTPVPIVSIHRNSSKMDRDRARVMNSNLIFVLLHYRQFVEQFEPVRKALTPVVSGAVALMFLMPILVRIHLDYVMQIHVDLTSTSSVRWSAVALSSSVLLPANVIIIPLCHLNSRCKKMHKTLMSLMAQIIRIRTHPMGVKLFDQHSVTVLEKELSHPDYMTSRFVIRSLFLNGTYATLIRAHFWWSFLVISILVDHQIGERQNSLILTLICDPFRLNN